jgi:hypothetical protein
MNDFWKITAPALIALIGTLIVVLFGYRQWRKQQEITRYGNFITEKQNAYKGLWEKLEEVHVKLRSKDVSQKEYKKCLLNINSYVLKQNLYIDETDKNLANEYLDSLYKLKELIKDSDDEGVRTEWETSMAIPEDVIKNARDLKHAQDKSNELRNKLIQNYKKIIGGSLT